jgi:hypothetical protein
MQPIRSNEVTDSVVIVPDTGVWELRNDCKEGKWKFGEETYLSDTLDMCVVAWITGVGIVPSFRSPEQICKAFDRNPETRGLIKKYLEEDNFYAIANIIKQKMIQEWGYIWFVPLSNFSEHVPKMTLCGTLVKSMGLIGQEKGLLGYLNKLKVNRSNFSGVVTRASIGYTHQNGKTGDKCKGVQLTSVDDKEVTKEQKQMITTVNEWFSTVEEINLPSKTCLQFETVDLRTATYQDIDDAKQIVLERTFNMALAMSTTEIIAPAIEVPALPGQAQAKLPA